jgi:hypothetical protein
MNRGCDGSASIFRRKRVDRAVVDFIVVHAAGIEQLIARENLLRGGEQGGEQVEFAVRQVNVARIALEPAGSQVELEFGESIGANLAALGLCDSSALRPSQHCADARQQLTGAEGLGQIVICTELESHDAVGFIADAGEHDNRYCRLVAECPDQGHAIFTCKPQVQDDQIDHLVCKDLGHLCAVQCDADSHSVLCKVLLQQLANLRVIVHGQDVRLGLVRLGVCHGLRPTFLRIRRFMQFTTVGLHCN